jgi:hypothetical protein
MIDLGDLGGVGDVGLVTGALLGTLLGARHALEPDHLAAVSTLVAERPRPRQAALLGALWGIGHAGALVIVGAVLLLARGQLPERAISAAELAVAVMLIVLGARGVRQALRGGAGEVAPHRHGAVTHAHAGAHDHVHLGARAVALRPLVIGLIHGLAGSGGLTALALAEMPSAGAAMVYIGAFGAGSVAGMAAVSGVVGASRGAVVHSARARAALIGAAGALSVVVGVVWGAAALGAA